MRKDDVPGLIRKFPPPVRRRARGVTLACALLAASPTATLAQGTQGSATFPVGIRELDCVDPHEGGRHLTLRVFYPAAIRERSATPFVLPFFTKLNLYKDAEAAGRDKHPLVVFSDECKSDLGRHRAEIVGDYFAKLKARPPFT